MRRGWRWIAVNRREVWGYIVWGAMGVVVGVPELWAAIDSKHVPWPTISGTVGYLEYWHTWVSIFVIGVLVWAAFHAVRVSSTTDRLDVKPGSNPDRQLVRAPGGRLSIAQRAQPIRAIVYFPVALAFVIVGAAIAHADRPGDKYLLGEVLYGLIAFWWMIVPGWLAYKHGRLVSFPTLFRTIQHLERRLRIIAVVFAAGIAVLLVHLTLYPWPSVIPDLQDLHQKYQQQRQEQKKQHQPSAYSQ
jgi:hypothetical protein